MRLTNSLHHVYKVHRCIIKFGGIYMCYSLLFKELNREFRNVLCLYVHFLFKKHMYEASIQRWIALYKYILHRKLRVINDMRTINDGLGRMPSVYSFCKRCRRLAEHVPDFLLWILLLRRSFEMTKLHALYSILFC